MAYKRIALLLCACIFVFARVQAQTSCPTNIDFELGNFTNWNLYTGFCCPISTPTPGQVTGRHTITSGTATDPFGGFPVVAPASGVYSLKLGNSNTNAEAERARYYVHVPSGVNNYSVIFRYAVVFEDPGHNAADQPRFEVKAFDSATNTIVNCSQFTYVAASNLPGFALSTVRNNTYYKSWSTASLNLTGYAGRTVAIDFASGDCSLGAHFGYGYVDMNCGLFQIQTLLNCDTASTISLSAPPGFDTYVWRDSATMSYITSGQSVNITKPTHTTTYAVILTPFSGFGCPDTLYTTVKVNNLSVDAGRDTSFCSAASTQLHATGTGTAIPLTYSWTPTTGLSCSTCVNPVATVSATKTYYVTVKDADNCSKTDSVKISISTLAINPSNDTTICNGSSVQLNAGATGNAPAFTYNWTPNTALSCTTCASPVSSTTVDRTYYVTVTDTFHCTKSDSVKIIFSNPSLAVSGQNLSCFNAQNGSATAVGSNGHSPYTYSWNTSPTRTTSTITSLAAGKYIVTLTDSVGCTRRDSVTLTQPNLLIASTSATTNVSCNNGNNGTATVSATGGTTPYTYSWNTTPTQTGTTATGLAAGNYIVTVRDSNGCSDTALAIITEPVKLVASVTATTNVSCHSGNNGAATVSTTGGTGSYTYRWNTSPAQTTATATGLTAGSYIVTVTDSNGCSDTALAVITEPTALDASIYSTTQVSCNGGNNGIAVATATGGTPNYTYSWNTSPAQTTATATGLTAGVYTITVTDAHGCTDTALATISQSTSLVASIASSTNIACYGGTNGAASVSVSGGTPSYTYSWNTTPARTTSSVTGLATGNYTVTVTDAKGCSSFATVAITQPAQLDAVIDSIKNVNCANGNDGTLSVYVSGGTPAYTYSWNTTPAKTTALVTGLTAGTYTVVVTDAHGCTDTATRAITQPTPLVAGIASTANVNCYGDNNGTASANVTGGTPGYTYSWSTTPTQTTQAAHNLAAGNYIVTVTDAKGCVDTALATITQPTLLNGYISSYQNVSCNGANNGTATVAANGGTAPYTYSWSTTPAQTTATITGLATGTYTATVTDAHGCTDTAIVVITEPNVLVATMGTVTNPNCNNGNGSATVVVTGGTPSYTYSWNTTPVQTTSTATLSGNGTYIVTVTDSHGCTDTAMATITQPALLTAAITSTTNVSCYNGSNGAATVLANGGTPGYTYSWNTTPAQTTATATGLTAGTKTVTVTDSKGCTYQVSATITQPTALIASTSSTNNVDCNGNKTGAATVSVNGGTPGYTYTWNTVPAQTTSAATGLGAGYYIVTVLDAHGCSDTATATITQPTALAAIPTTVDVGCFGGNTGHAGVTVSGGTPTYTYSWNTTPAQTTATTTGLPAGSYTVVVTDKNGCRDTAVSIIGQPSKLMVSIDSSNNVKCYDGNDGSAIASASGGAAPYAYNWNTSPAQKNALATTLPAGKYMVTVTDKNGCINSDTVTISQPAPFIATAQALSKTCIGSAGGEVEGYATGGVSPYTYTWNTTPVQTGTNATGLGAGSYTLTIKDANGCVASATTDIFNFPAMQLDLTPSSNLCQDKDFQLYVSGGNSYVWNDSSTLSCGSCSSPVAHPKITTTYQVIATDTNGCRDTGAVTLSIITRQDITKGPNQDICDGSSAQLHAAGGISYEWSPAGSLNNASIPDPVTSIHESTTFRVIIKENECFTDTLYQTINVHPMPTIDLGPDRKVSPGTPIQLHAAVTNANNIKWTPATYLSCDDCIDPVATLDKTMRYNAKVTNEAGCTAEDDILLTVSCDGTVMFVPNTFTPNGDGVNDVFLPSVTGIRTITHMAVYNRWGQIVYEVNNAPANDQRYGWDGTFKGQELTPDVYVYMINAFCTNGEPINVKGDISLIR
ncbi:MAG: gliding motility-associated C-terminal domain-containing protein [Bacteroidetes bacterium]|nr:gliding motility-associated C-terminal domain-containing protein [Bacteroidota bacterium]